MIGERKNIGAAPAERRNLKTENVSRK